MLFQILGTTAAVGSSGEVPLGGPRHRLLLAALLISPGRVVPTERLIEALWGDAPPASAAEMLHVRISELRKLLRSEPDDDGDQIVTRRPGYLLDIAPEQVDAHRFEQLATEGKRLLDVGDTTVATTRLADALALWRGPALADLADRAFARPEITRLDNLRVQALEDRISADLAAGRHRDVVAELEGLVQSHPMHERYRFQLMLALYRDGRQSDALELYQRTTDLLRDELGIDPGTELQELQISILRQDSALTVPTVAAAQASSRIDLPVQLTSFVGRDHELASAGDHLATARLVTLTGVGGVGKSRLAVELSLGQANGVIHEAAYRVVG